MPLPPKNQGNATYFTRKENRVEEVSAPNLMIFSNGHYKVVDISSIVYIFKLDGYSKIYCGDSVSYETKSSIESIYHRIKIFKSIKLVNPALIVNDIYFNVISKSGKGRLILKNEEEFYFEKGNINELIQNHLLV